MFMLEGMYMQDKKGQIGTGIISAVIALVIAVISFTAIAIPQLTNASTMANATGTTKIILDQLPIFGALGLLVIVVALSFNAVRGR